MLWTHNLKLNDRQSMEQVVTFFWTTKIKSEFHVLVFKIFGNNCWYVFNHGYIHGKCFKAHSSMEIAMKARNSG